MFLSRRTIRLKQVFLQIASMALGKNITCMTQLLYVMEALTLPTLKHRT